MENLAGMFYWDRHHRDSAGGTVWERGSPGPVLNVSDDLAERLLTAQLRIAELEQNLESCQVQGEAIAQVRGRVLEHRGQSIHLAVRKTDQEFFRLVVRVGDRGIVQAFEVGCLVKTSCRIVGQGRFELLELIDVQACEDPLPEVPEFTGGKVPDWFESNAKNPKRKMLKASEGSSSVSELRVHLVWATKRRGKILTPPMVERIKILAVEIAKEKALGELLAVNVDQETKDHVHVVLWTPTKMSASTAVGILKAHLSKALRSEFPELLTHDADHLWQRGFWAGGIGNGGDLSAVLAYVNSQSITDDNYKEGNDDDDDE